jgi:hypothetical protein
MKSMKNRGITDYIAKAIATVGVTTAIALSPYLASGQETQKDTNAGKVYTTNINDRKENQGHLMHLVIPYQELIHDDKNIPTEQNRVTITKDNTRVNYFLGNKDDTIEVAKEVQKYVRTAENGDKYISVDKSFEKFDAVLKYAKNYRTAMEELQTQEKRKGLESKIQEVSPQEREQLLRPIYGEKTEDVVRPTIEQVLRGFGLKK